MIATTSLPSLREVQTTLKGQPFAFTQLCFQMPQSNGQARMGTDWGRGLRPHPINSSNAQWSTIPNKCSKNGCLLRTHNFKTHPQALPSSHIAMTSKILFRKNGSSLFVQCQVRGWACPPLRAFLVLMVSA